MQKKRNQLEMDEEVAKQKLEIELDQELEATFPGERPSEDHSFCHAEAFFKTEPQNVKQPMTRFA
jgi:hypothetical protein